jgi:hypothetical protein
LNPPTNYQKGSDDQNLIQLSDNKSSEVQKSNDKRWVELPMCPEKSDKKGKKDDKDAPKDVPLMENLENAPIATCKKKGRIYIKQLEDQSPSAVD